MARESDIREKLNAESSSGDGQFEDVVDQLGLDDESVEIEEDDLENEESAPIIQLANRIIEEAHAVGSSDVHVEPGEK